MPTLTESERASALQAVRECAGKLRAIPRADLEGLARGSTGPDREVARLALLLADAEHGRQVDALSRAEGGPCRASMLADRTGARAVLEDV